MAQYIIGDSDSDISFKINGTIYDLHRNVITKSIFFKTLLDNEQFMGIKDDEIIIKDIYGVPINSDYVSETLNWMYFRNITKMSLFTMLTGCAVTENLIELLQYYTLSDFFQIDGLKEICKKEMSKMMPKIYPLLPKKISNKNNCYAHDGWNYYISCCNLGEWTSCEKDFKKILEIIYGGLAFFKKYTAVYFDQCIENNAKFVWSPAMKRHNINIDMNDIDKYILDSIRKNNGPIVHYDIIKKKLLLDDTNYCVDGNVYIWNIFQIYEQMYGSFHHNMYWIMNDGKNCLPIELVEVLMDIFPDNKYPVMLLDTSDWRNEKTLNWNNISLLENLCTHRNKLGFFKDKLGAYMEMCYF